MRNLRYVNEHVFPVKCKQNVIARVVWCEGVIASYLQELLVALYVSMCTLVFVQYFMLLHVFMNQLFALYTFSHHRSFTSFVAVAALA